MENLSRTGFRMDEQDLPQEDEFSPDLPNLQIITIMFDSASGEVPSLDLGNTSPWLAITLLETAIETLKMTIPPVDVTYKGHVICSSAFEVIDTEDEDYD